MTDGIRGLAFGNGDSLGDANALYFTAGPNSEDDGLFRRLKTRSPIAPARPASAAAPAVSHQSEPP